MLIDRGGCSLSEFGYWMYEVASMVSAYEAKAAKRRLTDKSDLELEMKTLRAKGFHV